MATRKEDAEWLRGLARDAALYIEPDTRIRFREIADRLDPDANRGKAPVNISVLIEQADEDLQAAGMANDPAVISARSTLAIAKLARAQLEIDKIDRTATVST